MPMTVTRLSVSLRHLDAKLAALDGVSTKRLNEQVKRNAERFSQYFLLRLSRPYRSRR